MERVADKQKWLDHIRGAREDAISALLARDALIRHAAAEGVSLRDIAGAANVSHETVRRIVART